MRRETFLRVTCVVIGANYLAQIPYGLHLYGLTASVLHSVPLVLTLLWFVLGVVLVARRRPVGYWVLLSFVTVEFAFYLYNTIGEVVHGYGLFFHLWNPDHLLAVVFAIGYINLLAGAYFLWYLLTHRRALSERVAITA